MNVFGLSAITALLIFSSVGSTVASDAVRCVQNELLALDYDVGKADGKLGERSGAAAAAYIERMKGWVDSTWEIAPLSEVTARVWCQSIAEAWPQVRRFWDQLQAKPAEDLAIASIDGPLLLTVNMDKGANFTVVAREKNKTIWTSAERGRKAAAWLVEIPREQVLNADTFCVLLENGWIVRDRSGKKFLGSCEPIVDMTRTAVRMTYSLTIERGQLN